MTAYIPADTRYKTMRYNRVGARRSDFRPSRSACGTTSAASIPSRTAAICCGEPSTWASRTSTWPTTTARRRARPKRTSARSCSKDLHPYRDEMIISSKAGYLMWPGPYGEWGSRKYLVASCDQSLKRMGLEYVDIFYSHRLDPDTPLEETMGALDHIVRCGQARCTPASPATAPEQTRAGRADPARAGHALPDPPAQLQHVQSLDRRRPAGRAARRGHGLHRVLAAGAGHADRQVPRTASRPTRARKPSTAAAPEQVTDEKRRESAPAERYRRGARPERWRRWRWPGCCAIPKSHRR